jgi:hypothetical protein
MWFLRPAGIKVSLSHRAKKECFMKLMVAASIALLVNQATPVFAAEAVVPVGKNLVTVVLVEQLSSKTAKLGDRFAIRAAEDLVVGPNVAVPAGAPGVGEVTRVVQKGAFGRSGKIEVRMLYLNVGGRQIALGGLAGDRGRSGTLPTIAVAAVAGLFSGFVTGQSAEIAAGSRLSAYVDETAMSGG